MRKYVEYAQRQTSAPLGYHLACAITLLGTTVPVPYGTFYAGSLRANLFTMLVGRSGEDQKSSALGIARELLFEAIPPLIGDFPGSAEGLIDSLQRQPTQMIPISELGKFLSSAQQGYFEPTKALMADLWDSLPTQRAKANGKVVRCDHPRLSMLAACSLPYLERYTDDTDWSGGFMGRWAVIYARRERTDPDPKGDRIGFDELKQTLYDRGTRPSLGFCMGLDKEAGAIWADWFNDVSRRDLPAQVVGVRARAPTIARKVALLYGSDFGPAHLDQDWYVTKKELIPAILFTELHIKSLVGLSDHICSSNDARQRRAVLGILAEEGGYASLGTILNRLKLKKRTVMETLDALTCEGLVARATLMGGSDAGGFYTLVDPLAHHVEDHSADDSGS